jgi:hypothetical protein
MNPAFLLQPYGYGQLSNIRTSHYTSHMETGYEDVAELTVALRQTTIGSTPTPIASTPCRQPVVHSEKASNRTASGCDACRDLVVNQDEILLKICSLESNSRLGCQSCLFLITILETYGPTSQHSHVGLLRVEDSTLKVFLHHTDSRIDFLLDVYTLEGL